MAKGINPSIARSYMLREDRGLAESERTTWSLRPLTVAERVGLQQLCAPGDGREQWDSMTFLREMLFRGLMAVHNYPVPDGNGGWTELPWPGAKRCPVGESDGQDEARERFLAHMRPAHADELVGVISEMSGLTEEQAGN